MAKKIKASLPSDLDLPDGYIVRWAAVDPATGAAVTGVKVTNVSIFGTALGAGFGDGNLPTGPFMLVPGPAA